MDVTSQKLFASFATSVDAFLNRTWWVIVAVAATVLQAVGVERVLGRVGPGTNPPLGDSVIFEYIGWYVSRGARLYVDAWEIKPPLPFEITTVLALMAGGDPVVLHRLSVATTCAAAVGSAVVIAALVRETTGDGTAAVAAGLVPFVLPAFHLRAAVGFKTKYFVIFFGLLGIYLALRERPFLAGASAAAAAWCWQFAAIFPVLVLGLAAQGWGRKPVVRTLGGIAAASLLVLTPVVLQGGVPAMIAQTILAPLLIPEGDTPVYRLHLTVRLLDAALPVALLGVYGIVRGAAPSFRDRLWWLPVGGAWFVGQALLLDLDTYPDLFVVLAFAAVGVGVLVGTVGPPDRTLLAGLLAIWVVTSVATLGGFGVGFDQVSAPEPEPVYDGPIDVQYNNTEESALFWRGQEPETCRAFAGKNQAVLVEKIGKSIDDRTCGDLDSTWAAVWNHSEGGGGAPRLSPRGSTPAELAPDGSLLL